MTCCYGLIVGSGFDAVESNEDVHRVSTRFGEPSAPIRSVQYSGRRVFVLPRHGDRHEYPPHLVNYRANLAALKDLGVSDVIALNTVGVIGDVREPGQIAIPDQIIDYTWGRSHTIYDTPAPEFAHLECTQPLSAALRTRLCDAATSAGIDCMDGGVYAATQGPRLETAAEIDRFERDGADFVGMTAMPEAALAMELGLAYACLSLIVNRAAGRGHKPIHDDVESSTLVARASAMQLLEQFFGEDDGSQS